MSLDSKKYMRKIKSHKLYRAVSGKIKGDPKINKEQTIVFLEQFIEDPECPPDIKDWLYWWVGALYGELKDAGRYKDFERHRFLIERWQEICR